MDETKARGIISDLVGKNKDIQAVIAGDKGIAYGDVMHIVDLVKVLGVTKFAMATDGT
jgi:biopolymer transport protein ExbD